jgi:hypothetical protein
MKISRKMHRQVELKIRHAMATGTLPVLERGSTGETDPKLELDKADGNGNAHSK